MKNEHSQSYFMDKVSTTRFPLGLRRTVSLARRENGYVISGVDFDYIARKAGYENGAADLLKAAITGQKEQSNQLALELTGKSDSSCDGRVDNIINMLEGLRWKETRLNDAGK
jgi:hypothetical protein